MKIFFKYTFIVSIAFSADFLALLLIDSNFGFNRNYVSIVSYLIGLLVSYILLKKFIYTHSNKNKVFQLSMFIFSGISMSLMTGLIFFITFSLGITNILVQKIIASTVTFSTLFIFRNNYIFKNKS